MTLAHPLIEKKIDLKCFEPTSIIIENPQVLSALIKDFYRAVNGEESLLYLSENCEELDLKKSLCFVSDPFRVELNSRSILNKLFGDLRDIAYGAEYFEQTNELKTQIFQWTQSLIDSSSTNLVYNPSFDLRALFKAVDLEFNKDSYLDMVDELTEFAMVNRAVFGSKLFVFLNLNSFLTTEELETLVLFFKQNELTLLLIDSFDKNMILDHNIVVDMDHCVI